VRFFYFCLALSALSANAFGQSEFHVSGSGSAEYHYADSAWLFRSARQLLDWDQEGLLASLAKGTKEPARAQAAGLVMLYADNPRFIERFIRPLLKLLDSGDASLFYIGHKAVELYPYASYYLLPDMVGTGSEMAAYELSRFGEEGKKKLKELTHSKNAKARVAALSYYNDRQGLPELLGDPDSRVVGKAVRGLLGLAYEDPKIEDRLLQDSRPRVRLAAATAAGRWSQRNWPLWIKLARDPQPTVRSMAMLHLTPLGLSWGKGPWISDGIAAVGRGLQDKSPEVRRTAVVAVRGWMLEWETIAKRWSPAQIAAGKRIIGGDPFHVAIVKLAKAETQEFGSVDREGVQMALASKALAISNEIRRR